MAVDAIEVEGSVRQLVADVTGVPFHRLHGDTNLFRGVGVDGMDADQLLQSFCTKFDVDYRAIDYDRHFGPELPFNLLALLRPSWWAWQRNRIPVTIDVLVLAARTKSWPIKYEGAAK